MSGATSFIHVHVTLGIDLLTQQIDNYRHILNTTFSTKESLFQLFRNHIPDLKPNSTDSRIQNNYFNSMAVLWLKIAQQHRLDVMDMYVHLASLKNTMPDLPNRKVKTISSRSTKRSDLFDDQDIQRFKQVAHEQGLDAAPFIKTHNPSPEAPAKKDFDPNHILNMMLNIIPPTATSTGNYFNIRTNGEAYIAAKKKRPMHVIDGSILLPVNRRRRQTRRRRKRFAGAVALPLAIAATAMGIYNTDQINFLKTELGKLQENQDRLFDIVYRHENMLEEITNAIISAASAMVAILIFNPALFDSRLTRIENQLRHQLTKTTHALQAGLVRKLAVDYLTPMEIRNLFSELSKTAERLKCDLLIDHHSDLFQLETSLLFDGNDAHLLVHVPMVPHQALLRLYKLHPIPLPLSDTYFLIPDVKNDVLAISASDNRFAVQLSSMDLMGCYRANQMFMCDRFGVLTRGYNDTCLGSLYNQQFQTAQHLCKFEVAPITERVYQLKKHHFLVYLPSALTIPIKCRNGSTTEKHLARGHQEIFISPGCEAEFQQHRIMTDTSITFPSDVIHFEWQWDQLGITEFMDPVDLPADLLRLAETGITRPTLADLQFLALTKQKIGEMIKPEDWGLNFIHTLGSATLGICILIVLIYFGYRCYQRRQKSPHTTSSETPSSSFVREHPNIIINTSSPSAPSRAASAETENDEHPLASTRYFQRQPKSAPPIPKGQRYSDQPVRFNVRNDEVLLPYEPSQTTLEREVLLQRRDDLVASLSTIDDHLYHHSNTNPEPAVK